MHLQAAAIALVPLSLALLAPPLAAGPTSAPSWTVESNQWFADFGISVGTAGDVNGDGFSDLIVGARFLGNGEPAEGRAYVYLGTPAGLALDPAWTAESNRDSTYFGYSVASAGDVNGDGFADVLVGAYGYTGGEEAEGKAFLYLGGASGLGTDPAWSFESDQPRAWFGISVAAAGDVNRDGFGDVVIGAGAFSNGEDGEGKAFLFLGSAAGLGDTPAWTAESNQAHAFFGVPVATAGDVNGDGYADVLVGATLYDNGEGNEGRAYLYLGSASGLAAGPAWIREGNQVDAEFGRVATAGDVNGDGFADVIVGAWKYDRDYENEGRAFLFLGSAAGLAAAPSWTAQGNQTGANLGIPVSTAGDVNGDGFSDVILGEWVYDSVLPDVGAAVIYLGSPSGLKSEIAWRAVGDQSFSEFGLSTATAGDVNGDGFSDIVIGAPAYDSEQVNEGRAMVYHGGPVGLASLPSWTAERTQFLARFGQALSTAGDVNGDGYSDVIAGTPGYDHGQLDEGRAEIMLGSAAGLATTTPAWTAESDQPGAAFGSAVAWAGDVNGDGYSDVIVGAPGFDHGETDEGRVFLFRGGPAGVEGSPSWVAESDQAFSRFGTAVAGVGDVNGDGFADVLIGSDRYDGGETDEGRAVLYLGSPSGLGAVPAWIGECDQAGARFGGAVSGAGDVNGDGYADVAVGAETLANGEVEEGRVFVYLGNPTGLGATPAWTAEGDQSGARFGHAVACAGDVNGDGYADLVVGADGWDGGKGRAVLFRGSATGLAPVASWVVSGGEVDEHLGSAVVSAGDVNGDGYAEVAVAAPFDAVGGRVEVYHGGVSGLATAASWMAQSAQNGGGFGEAMGGGVDVNGDGFGDLVVGAPRHDLMSGDEGRVVVFGGNEGGGLPRIARMARVDGAPIDLFGRSDAESGLRLRAGGRTPGGRGHVRLEWEVKPAAVPFDGIGMQAGAFLDTGLPGAGGSTVPLDELVSGLEGNTLYRWRVRWVGDSPFFPRSPWLSPPGNTRSEADVRTAQVVGVGGPEPVPPVRFGFEWARPNPFATSTTLHVMVPEAARTRLEVVDVLGRRVAVLVDARLAAGQHVVPWDGRDGRGQRVGAGIYFARLVQPGRADAVSRLVRLP